MKRFMVFIVTVLTVLFFSAIVFAAPAIKVVATATEVVAEKMVIVKSSPTKVIEKIADPKQDKGNIPVNGGLTVEYTVTEATDIEMVNKITKKKEGDAVLQKEKYVIQNNQVTGIVTTGFDDNNKPCAVTEKEDWQKILWGDENKRIRLNVRFQIEAGVKTTDDISDTKNGIETSEKGDSLALLEYSGQFNVNDHVSVFLGRNAGKRFQNVKIMNMSIGGLFISETTVLVKWYPCEVYGVNPYFGLGARFVHIDGGYNMGGIPINVSGNETIIGTRFGLEAPVTSKWAIDIWGEYFKSKIIASLPQAGDSSTETTWRAGLGVIRYF